MLRFCLVLIIINISKVKIIINAMPISSVYFEIYAKKNETCTQMNVQIFKLILFIFLTF